MLALALLALVSSHPAEAAVGIAPSTEKVLPEKGRNLEVELLRAVTENELLGFAHEAHVDGVFPLCD